MNPPGKSSVGLYVIATFKVFKGVLLLILAIGVLGLLHHDLQREAENWINVFRIDPSNKHVAELLAKLGLMNDHKLEGLSALTFVYALIFLTEGVGLFLKKRWAEYLTVIVTASLIPLEIYEICHGASPAKIVLLAGNILIVAYLVVRLRKERRSDSAPRSPVNAAAMRPAGQSSGAGVS